MLDVPHICGGISKICWEIRTVALAGFRCVSVKVPRLLKWYTSGVLEPGVDGDHEWE